jgi:hypothetical protein
MVYEENSYVESCQHLSTPYVGISLLFDVQGDSKFPIHFTKRLLQR